MYADGLKLTKKYFMELPKNVYVMSNTFDEDGPCFLGSVGNTPVERERIWKIIVANRVNGRKCCVFDNEEEARWHIEGLEAIVEAQKARRMQAVANVRANLRVVK